MNSNIYRSLICCILLVLSGASVADQRYPQGLYGVILGITIGAQGELESFRVAQVIDALSGSKDSVDVQPPPEYVALAREKVIGIGYEPKIENGEPVEFFTYFFYDPTQPTNMDIDPSAE